MSTSRSTPATGAALIRGLALACHPGPTIAVTAFVTALAIGAGHSAAVCVLVGLALLTGQLSIGWSNDWIDAARDIAVHRPDKPVASGVVTAATVRTAALAAVGVCVPLSLALGWRAGLIHLVAVAAGWAYNAGLKSSAFSWLPYAVAFGLMPAVVTLALPGHPFAPGWTVAAGALLGVGAHLANVLPDFDDDRDTGIRGFPHRIGRRASTLSCPVLLLAASLLITLGPAGPPSVWQWIGLLLAGVLAVAATVVAGRVVPPGTRPSRLPFLLSIGVAGVDVVMLVAVGSRIV